MEESGSGSAATPKTTQKKSYSRRVSFNEDTILPPKERHRDYSSDIESRISGNPLRRRICGRLCHSCCFWISLILALILFLLILCGGMYYGFLKSHLPEIRLRRLNVGRIDVVPANKDAAVTANLTVLLDAINRGDKTELIYSRMSASVAASGVQFGVVRLADVRQQPGNSTVLEVAAGVKDAVMGDWAARDLQSSAEAHALRIDVNVKGRIDLVISGKKMNGFPFIIECLKINQSEIDAGHAPPCSTQLSP